MRWQVIFILCVIALILADMALSLKFVRFVHASNAIQSMSEKSVQSFFPSLSKHTSNRTQSSKSSAQLATANVFTLKAAKIVGTNAHLTTNLATGHGTLTFTASTITGFQLSYPITGATVTITSGGQVITTGSAITTSLASFLATAKSFAHPTDLGVLVTGGTVQSLELDNVTLTVDTSIQINNMDTTQFKLSVA